MQCNAELGLDPGTYRVLGETGLESVAAATEVVLTSKLFLTIDRLGQL